MCRERHINRNSIFIIQSNSFLSSYQILFLSSNQPPVEEAKKGPPPQERLESIWQQLNMPDALRLDMAIKYSCNEHFNKLNEVTF